MTFYKSDFKQRIRQHFGAEAKPQPADRLSGFPNHYKIKLRFSGYRLVYEVVKKEICVYVIAAGKRDRSSVYKSATKRSKKTEDN